MGKSSGAGSPLATGAMFFGAGFGIASTFSRMPGIRDQLGVSPAACLRSGFPRNWIAPGAAICRAARRTVFLANSKSDRNRRLSWRLRSTSLESLPV
jgi:hypothetical protein